MAHSPRCKLDILRLLVNRLLVVILKRDSVLPSEIVKEVWSGKGRGRMYS